MFKLTFKKLFFKIYNFNYVTRYPYLAQKHKTLKIIEKVQKM